MRKDIVFQVAQRFVSAPNAGFAVSLTANVYKKDGAIFAIALDGKCVQILWQMVFCLRAIAKIRQSVLPCGFLTERVHKRLQKLTANVHKKDGAIFAIALDGKCVQILWQMVFSCAFAKIRRSVLPCGLFARPFGQSRPFSKIQTGKKKCVVDVAKI